MPSIKPLAACLLLALSTHAGSATLAAAAPAREHSRPALGSALPVTSCADDGGSGTLRNVVAAATSGDTVDLSQLDCATITLLTGQIEVQVDDLTIAGPGRERLSIDGNDAGRIFLHGRTGTLTLSGITLTHGRADATTTASPSPEFAAVGGCVFAKNLSGPSGAVVLVDATVTACKAVHAAQVPGTIAAGGGIYAGNALTLTRSTVSNNLASGVGSAQAEGIDALGGGVRASGLVTLTDSTVSGNRASTGDPTPLHLAAGGGIAASDVVATNSSVTNNFAGCDTAVDACRKSTGGGIAVNGSVQTTIAASVISNNTLSASGDAFGAGLYTYTGSAPTNVATTTIAGNTASSAAEQAKGGGLFTKAGSLNLSDSTVSGNTATIGGGVFADYNRLTITNSTISGNAAGTGAGLYLGDYHGYYSSTWPMSVRNSTIVGNVASAATGIGGVVDTHTSSGRSTFQSTIIAGNTAPLAAAADLSANLAAIAGTNNLIANAAGVALPPNTLASDPMLGPLQNNGGATFTHALAAGSPAIDAGNNAANVPFDQRGAGNPRVVGTAADIGAFEYRPSFSAPMLGLGFAPDTITVGGVSTLTLTLSNGNGVAAVLSANLVDTLPAPIVVADPAAATTTCAGGSLSTDPGGTIVTLSGAAEIPAAGSCTVTLSVTVAEAGTYTHTIAAGALQTTLGNSVDAATATLTATLPINQPPVATGDHYTVEQDTSLTQSAPGVLANDADAEADALTAVLVAGPEHGALSLNADGSFTYVPASGFVGADGFRYRANDGQADSEIAEVTIAVTERVNDAIFKNGFDAL